MGIGVEELV